MDMDIKRLKEISDCGRELYMLSDENLIERIRSNNQLQNYLSDSVDAIDEAITHQSVTSEEVQEAIEWHKDCLQYYKDEDKVIRSHYGGDLPSWVDESIKASNISIAALQAYRPKPDCESAEKCGDKCCGYGKSEYDDEPIDVCKCCDKQVSFGEDTNDDDDE